MTGINAAKGFSRRSFLKGGAAVGGVALVSFSQLFGYSSLFAQDAMADGDDAQTILNLAATAETLACTHYYAAITSGGIAFSEPEMAYLKAALDSELQHLEFLNANGATALTQEFYTPLNVFTDKATFAAVSEVAETAFIGAYLAAVRRITELGNPLLAATAAQVAAVESQHLAFVRQIGEKLPNNVSLERTPFYNVSDAVPTLQPFLAGGDGFEGPSKYPGAEAIRAAIGVTGLESIKPFVDPTLFAVAMTPEAMMATCMITARNSDVNIRGEATTSAAPVGVLRAGTATTVDGQKQGDDGKMWWRVQSGGWIRSDTVNAEATCGSLPTV